MYAYGLYGLLVRLIRMLSAGAPGLPRLGENDAAVAAPSSKRSCRPETSCVDAALHLPRSWSEKSPERVHRLSVFSASRLASSWWELRAKEVSSIGTRARPKSWQAKGCLGAQCARRQSHVC